MVAMQIVFLLLTAFYVFMMPVLFVNWHGLFCQDVENLSGSEKRISLTVLAIATLAWPLVLPFAYIELLDQVKRLNQTARLYHPSKGRTKSQSESPTDSIHCSNN